MLELVPDDPKYCADVERTLDRAFGPGRHAKTSERVRENGAECLPALSRIALSDGRAIGCCRLWRIAVGEQDALFLGPLAVDPDHQHHGLGADLVRAALNEAAKTHFGAVLLIGAPSFFAPLGFQPAPPAIALPGPVDPKRFMGFALKPGALETLNGAVTAPRGASPASRE
ncbi:MAG: GNAT family N-acetyltransferase [Alphaproteobacteria bacterium]|nr:GNAT family N-acetyltransferase [Alphaproteobacteria bacterium]